MSIYLGRFTFRSEESDASYHRWRYVCLLYLCQKLFYVMTPYEWHLTFSYNDQQHLRYPSSMQRRQQQLQQIMPKTKILSSYQSWLKTQGFKLQKSDIWRIISVVTDKCLLRTLVVLLTCKMLCLSRWLVKLTKAEEIKYFLFDWMIWYSLC